MRVDRASPSLRAVVALLVLELVLMSGALLHVSSFAPVHMTTTSTSTTTTSLYAETTTTTTTATTTPKRRVVVTGLGVISGCGIGADDFFAAVCKGTSSVRRVQRFDPQYYPCQIASEVPDELFDARDHFVNLKNVKSNDRFTHFAVAAARQALQDAKLGDTPETLLMNPERIGVMVGTAFGGMETLEQETLKLARKPERPKVCSMLCAVFCICYICCVLQLQLLYDRLTTTNHSIHTHSNKNKGIPLHHPRTLGQHGVRTDWH